MENKNFRIEKNYAIDLGGRQIDLHNNFDFVGLNYCIKNNTLYLAWLKSEGAWVSSSEFKEVEIVFENVMFLKVLHQDFGSEDLDSAKILTLLGYLHPDDVEIMDGSLDENEAKSNYHMIFLFEGGLAIKAFASKVICKVK